MSRAANAADIAGEPAQQILRQGQLRSQSHGAESITNAAADMAAGLHHTGFGGSLVRHTFDHYCHIAVHHRLVEAVHTGLAERWQAGNPEEVAVVHREVPSCAAGHTDLVGLVVEGSPGLGAELLGEPVHLPACAGSLLPSSSPSILCGFL